MINPISVPDFIIVGAHKCGTTSLFDTITSSKSVFRPAVKEPHFFVSEQVSNTVSGVVSEPEEYFSLFADKGDLISGEASVLYLRYSTIAARNIRELTGPQTKIIVCVRDPVRRAYSAYLDVSRHNELETRSFEQALADEISCSVPDGMPPTAEYLRVGNYLPDIIEFNRHFENVYVVVLEELIQEPALEIARIFSFLGLSNFDLPGLAAANKGNSTWKNSFSRAIVLSLLPRERRQVLRKKFPRVHNTLAKAGEKILYKDADNMTANAKEILVDFYSDQIYMIEQYLGRKLIHWYR